MNRAIRKIFNLTVPLAKAGCRYLLGLCLAMQCMTAPAAAPSTLRFEHLSVEQGLVQETVTAIAQDRQGFMWFGSQGGLSRFDGYRVTLYKNSPSDLRSLADNWVQALHVDTLGQLWIGTRGGLQRYDPATDDFTQLSPEGTGKDIGHHYVQAILGDGAKGLWIATDQGLQHFDFLTKKFAVLRHDSADAGSLRDDNVAALANDADGNLWVGTANGIDRMLPGSGGFQHFQMDGKSGAVTALLIENEQSVWVGTRNGLENLKLRSTGNEVRHFGKANGIVPGWIISLYRDHDANLWVGTYRDGLYRWDAAAARFIAYHEQRTDRPTDNEVASLYQDRTGTLWVGTWTAGVKRVDLASGGFSRFFHVPGDPNSLSNSRVYKISGADGGRLWLDTDDSLSRLDPASGYSEHWSTPALQDNPLVHPVTILSEKLAKKWAGTKYDASTGHFTFPSFATGDPKSDVFNQVVSDHADTIWIASHAGLHRIDSTGTAKTLRNDPADPASLSDDLIRMVLEDSSHTLWVGTKRGLDRLDNASGSFSHFRHDANDAGSLNHDNVQYIFEDKAGRIWVGTTGGLNLMEKAAGGKIRFRSYSAKDGMAADSIGAILEDGDGKLWISTTAGISRFDPATEKFQNYTGRDGMIDGTYFVGSAYHAADGSLYFGGFNGLTAFRPEMVHSNPYPPQVAITDFQIFNQSVRGPNRPAGLQMPSAISDTRALTLSYRHSVFSIEFAALHFADPARNRYAYQLQGFDADWVYTDASKHIATYTNLDPGHYVFRVKAANKDGIWNESGVLLDIAITPPFWKTWWFRLLLAVLLVAILWTVDRARVRVLTEKKELLEKQISIRTAEVLQQKEIVEQKNLLLESQKEEVELQKQVAENRRIEAELRREESEQQRENVELAHRNISVLSEIGRAITATLDRETIMGIVYKHVTQLMHADVFSIALCHDAEREIEVPFSIKHGQRCAPHKHDLDDTSTLTSWCIRHRKEIFINDIESQSKLYADEPGRSKLPKTAPADARCQSMMYVPMLIQDRVMGVINVQSVEKNGYQATHLDMLLTLASYAAVALENADSYRHLQSAQQQLVLQEKMASLGTLTAGVAHEINNPTNFAHVGAQALGNELDRFRNFLLELAGDDADEEVLNSLDKRIDSLASQIRTIIEGTTRIKHLVLDLRTFSRLDQAETQSVAIADSLRSTINLVRIQFAGSAEIAFELDANPVLECRPAELNQVFMNLIVNACQSIQSKQRKNGTAAPGLLTIRSRIQGSWLVIEFADNGEGIPDTIIDHIFEPFFTTKTVGEGTGLGLSISFGIIEKHHGNIRVTSAEGQGSCFVVTLPIDNEASAET